MQEYRDKFNKTLYKKESGYLGSFLLVKVDYLLYNLINNFMGESALSNFYITLVIWNFIVVLIYGIDKVRAKKGMWRISELTLLGCAFILGGFGAMCGMVLFNHKTSKLKFRVLVPIAFVILVLLICRYETMC